MRRRVGSMVLVLLLAACASTGTRESAAPSPSGAGIPTTDAASVPAGAPFDAVPAVGGGQVDGAALAGRDLALWFWAPW